MQKHMLTFTQTYLWEPFASCSFSELFKDAVVPPKPVFLSGVAMKLEMLGWRLYKEVSFWAQVHPVILEEKQLNLPDSREKLC